MADSIPARIYLDARKVAKEVADAVSGDIDDFFRNFARKHRAAVAEEIAQAIEAHGKASRDFLDRAELPVNPRYAETIVLTVAQAAAIARSHAAAAGTDTAEGEAT